MPKVVFHCALSRCVSSSLPAPCVLTLSAEVRGPKAARIYAEELARQTPTSAASAPTADLPTPAAAAAFSPNPYTAAERASTQEVLVLRDGFTGWQALYRVSLGN